MKKHLVIIGKVQGVGFRYWMKNLAINNNINGWVKNKLSGYVEALINIFNCKDKAKVSGSQWSLMDVSQVLVSLASRIFT